MSLFSFAFCGMTPVGCLLLKVCGC